jgi:hypothetical protein
VSALTEADYLEFLKLKIHKEIVDRARIFRVTAQEASEEYGIVLDCDGGRCFPYFLPPLNGNDPKRAVAFSVRQDAPRHDGAGKPQRKYVATAGRQHPYVPPVRSRERFSDPTVPVILVEAQKSALSLLRWSEDHDHRMIPIGIAGCYGWRGTTGIETDAHGEHVPQKGLLPGLAAICRGHRVYILLDANAATNAAVQYGRDWLAQTLLEEKITGDVRILSLPIAIAAPYWNGVDDFIALAGDEAFRDVFETARRFEATNWETAFHRVAELAAGEPEAIIGGYFEEGLSFLGAKSGVGKTWIAISEGQALRTGQKFLDVFPVPTQRNVLYLIPEMTERRFRNRCEKLQMDINDPGFLVRTMNDGAPLPLNDPILRQCVEKFQPVIYLDTAIRFASGKEENSAGEVSQGLISATYQLIKLGSPAVRGLHHRAKDASDDELSLENVLRGSSDFGAGAVCVWGAALETASRAGKTLDARGRGKSDNKARQRLESEYLAESRKLGRCYLQCVKPGDRELLAWNFRIQLRPSIDETGKIEMLTVVLPAINESRVVNDFFAADPTASAEALAERLHVSRSTAWRRAKQYGWSRDEQSGLWTR